MTEKNKTLKLSGHKIVIPIERMTDDEVIPGENEEAFDNEVIKANPDEMVVNVSFKIVPREYNGHEKFKTRVSLQTFTVELVGEMLRGLADLPHAVTIKVASGTMRMEKEIKL